MFDDEQPEESAPAEENAPKKRGRPRREGSPQVSSSYIVLQFQGDAPEDVMGAMLTVVAQQEGRTKDDAIRRVAANSENNEAGSYVAIPSKSFQPRTVTKFVPEAQISLR